MMSFRNLFSASAFAFAFFAVFASAASSSIDVAENFSAPPGGLINFTILHNVSSELNFTFWIGNATNSSIFSFSNESNGTGYLASNFSTTGLPPGDYNLTLYDNSTDNHSVRLPFFVTNVGAGNFTFNDAKPPFGNGSSFTINFSMGNASGVVENYTPKLEVYKVNGGNQTAWNFTNLSTQMDSNGTIVFNVSIPSNAEGQFVIVGERGLITKVFSISALYTISATTSLNTSSGSVSSEELRGVFGTSSTVLIKAKVRNSDGDPITLAASDTIYALITYPNNTVLNASMSVLDATNLPGEYYYNFANTGTAGAYQVKVVAAISGLAYEAYTAFSVGSMQGRLEVSKDFGFKEWGDEAAFRPSSQISLLAVLMNTSSGDFFVGGNGAGNTLNCSTTNFTYVDTTNLVTGANVTSIASVGVSIQGFRGRSSCAVNFTTPATNGLYRMRVNVTHQGSTVTLEGVFAVQEYFLKAAAINEAGGDFMTMVYPGTNLTLSLSAFNTSSNQPVAGSVLNNFTVVRLVPIEFKGGVSENKTPYYTTDDALDQITLAMPTEALGPVLIEITANVSVIGTNGNIIRGNAFVFSKYVVGFMSPTSQQVGPPGGPGPFAEPEGGQPPSGPGDKFGGEMAMKCSGTKTFNAQMMDVKTGQPAQDVRIEDVFEVRNEETGKDVTSCVTLLSNVTGSRGSAQVNVTFSGVAGCSFTGMHFMLVNVSYLGRYENIPSGFNCQSLSFFLDVRNANDFSSNGPPRVGPYSLLNLSVQGIKSYDAVGGVGTNNVNGTLRLLFIRTFTSGVGEKIYYPNAPLNGSVNGGRGTFLMNSSNFSLAAWPFGGTEVVTQLTDNSTWTNVTGRGGFFIMPFDAWVVQEGRGPIGTNVSWIINASTNVSSAGNFTVQMGQPWKGNFPYATVVNTTILADGWNSSADRGAEQWNVTFTIPSGLDQGGTEILIMVNSSASDTYGQTAEIRRGMDTGNGPGNPSGGGGGGGGTSFNNYDVVSPKREVVQMDYECRTIVLYSNNQSSYNCTGMMRPPQPGQPPGANQPYQPRNFTSSPTLGMGVNPNFGFNMSLLNGTHSISSKSNRTCVKLAFNSTREGRFGGDATQFYDNIDATALMLVDNASAGVYDTLVLQSIFPGDPLPVVTVRVFNASTLNVNRTLNSTNSVTGKVYLRKIEGCEVLEVTTPNSAYTNTYGGSNGQAAYQEKTWLGDFATNQNVIVPFVVRRGAANMSGMNVSVQNIAMQAMGNRGFDGNLPAANFNYDHAITDVNGMAFVRLNVTRSGDYELFWALNKTSPTSTLAKATFQNSAPFRMRPFQLYTRSSMEGASLSSTQNSSNVTLCAETFNRKPEVVNFTVYLRQMNPPNPDVLTALNLYNASTGANLTISGISTSAVSNAVDGGEGPGCVKFKIGPVGTWPSCTSRDFVYRAVNATDGIEQMPTPMMNFGGCS